MKKTLKSSFVALTYCLSVSANAHTFPLDNLLPFYVDWNAILNPQQVVNSEINADLIATRPTSTRPIAQLVPTLQLRTGQLLTALMQTFLFRINTEASGPRFAYLNRLDRDFCHLTLLDNNYPQSGNKETRLNSWRDICDDFGFPITRITSLDRYTYGPVIRRKALDGSEYEATSLKISRDGFDWETHYFGYNLGLVAQSSNWDPANRDASSQLLQYIGEPDPAFDVDLVSLPPPWVESTVEEYVNTYDFPQQPMGQFFYAVRDDDKVLLDSLPN